MEAISRFDRAITKLYEAFHTDRLNPLCCKQCAVGNICDNTDLWKHLVKAHGSTELSYLGKLNETFGRKVYGYAPSELLQIEVAFLRACGYELPLHLTTNKPKLDKDKLFRGLVATVAVLCDLEGIPNVMDCSALFDFEPAQSVAEMVPECIE